MLTKSHHITFEQGGFLVADSAMALHEVHISSITDVGRA
jgi:hypothetical protein